MAKGKSGLFSSVLESLGFSRRKVRSHGKRRLLKLEPLENRRLLTASVSLAKTYTITDDGSHYFEGATTPAAAQISAASESSTAVTITTSVAHGFSAGEKVIVTGVTNAGYDGTFTIASVPTNTTFTYTDTSGLGNTSVGAGASATAWFGGDVMNYSITVTNTNLDGQNTAVDNVVVTDDLTPSSDGATLISGTVVANPSSLIAAAAESGTTVTITTLSAHGFSAGEQVTIAGLGTSGYDGTFTIASVPTATTFTYTDSSGLGNTIVGVGNSATASAATSADYPTGVPQPTVDATSNVLTFEGSGANGFVLSAGDSVTITYQAAVNTGTNYVMNSANGTYNDPSQGGAQEDMIPAYVWVSTLVGTPTPLANIIVQQPQSAVTTSGASVTYEIIVSNKGPSDATAVPIYDSSTSELTINSWSIDATDTTGSGDQVIDPNTNLQVTSGTCDPTTGLVESLNIPHNTQIALHVVATINSSVPGGSQVANIALTTSPNNLTYVDTDPNYYSATTYVSSPAAPVSVTIAKTAYAGTVTPGNGQSISGLYTITVTNTDSNASDITNDITVAGVTLTDGLSALPLSSLSWTAAETDPNNLDPSNVNGNLLSGSGSIDETLTLSPGESITYTIAGIVNANAEVAAGGLNLANTATVTMPSGYVDSVTGTSTDTAKATLVLAPSVGLTVTKTDSTGGTAATPGTAVTYTIAVSNSGPSDATNVQVTDALGAGSNASGATWTETGAGTASGTGALSATVADLAVGATATFKEVVPIASSTTLTSTTDTATAATADPTTGGSVLSASDTVNIGPPAATLKVVKSDSSITVVPGAVATYTVTVSNEGPSDATSIQLSDAVDSAINSSSLGWSATPSGTNTTTGATYSLGTLAAGQTATVYLHATVLSSAAAGLGLTSTTDTISATDFSGTSATLDAGSTLSDTLTLTPQADLGVTKADSDGGNSTTGGIGQVTPGGPITYTITVTNNGPSDVSGAKVSDTLPSQITGADLLSVTPSGSATSGAATGSLSSLSDTVSMPVGSSIVYVISATVSSSANVSEFTNTATIAAPSGTTDPVSANNSATVTDGLPCDLVITKTDNDGGNSATPTTGSAAPGNKISYTITVSNAGPAAATGATVTDALPSQLSGLTLVSVTTSGSATSSDTPGAISNFNFHDTVSLPNGGQVVYVISGTIPSSATGTLSNTATVAPPSGTPDSNLNTTATDTDNLAPAGDLSITKKDSDGGNSTTSATGTAMPGANITYTIVASNSGPSDVTGATISDAFPAGFTVSSVTGTATANAAGAKPTGFTASGTANISDTVNMPAGTSITYVVAGKINSSLPAGSLSNTASIAAPASGFTDTNLLDNSATVTDTLVPTADLQITKSDSAGGNSATGAIGNTPPGSNITYTVTVTNAGPSDVTGATVSDTLPAALGSLALVSVTPSDGTAALTGSSFSDTVNLSAGSSIKYVISATVSLSATGTLANSATVTAPAGVTDPNLNNNSATDTDTLTKADLVLSVSGQSTAVTGHDVIYQINVTNYGPGVAQNVVVTDTLPAGMTFVSATSSNAAMLPVSTTVNANGTTTVAFTGAVMGIGAAPTSSETIVIDATVNSNVASGTKLVSNVAVTTPTTQAANAGHSPVGSATFTTQVNVNGVSLVPSMINPGKMDLVITDGPSSFNTVMVVPSGSSGSDTVIIDGRLQGNFSPTGRIIVYGDSNDYEWVSPLIKLSSWLYGGSGRDYLYGGGGNNVIIGGPGTNYISGGSGSNLLIGGGGGGNPNYIMGTTGNNLEISGTTSYNANQAALNAILQEWANPKDSYSTRVADITQTGLTVNGSTVKLTSSTIQRVAAYEYLFGGTGQNLYFATQTGSTFNRDYLIGRKSNETILPS